MNANEVTLRIWEMNREHAIENGIAMDAREWNRDETYQYYGYIDCKMRLDGFPVFIRCGVVDE